MFIFIYLSFVCIIDDFFLFSTLFCLMISSKTCPLSSDVAGCLVASVIIVYPSGSYRFFTSVMSGYGIEVTYVDMSDLKKTEDAIKPNTKVKASTPHSLQHVTWITIANWHVTVF